MRKLISMALLLILCMGILSMLAFAADDKMIVKVIAPDEWEECYVYTWEPELFGSWPGTKLTDATFDLISDVDGMVISAGQSKPQTMDIRDLTYIAGAEATITIGEAGVDGKYTYSIDVPTKPVPTTAKPSETTQPTTAQPEKYTLTVEAPSSWTTVYVYTWDPEVFDGYPGSPMLRKTDNTFEFEIGGNVRNLIFTNQDGMKTDDLVIRPGSDVDVKISPDARAVITYPGQPVIRPVPLPEEYELSNYRVVGNTDWLGTWDAAFEGGRMLDMGNGIYRKSFKDVPCGSYEIKITKDGKWDGAYGAEDGQNFKFTVTQKCNVTVDFVIKEGKGIIEVYGMTIGWDEDDEQNPETSDLSVLISATLLLACIATLPVVLNKRRNIQ